MPHDVHGDSIPRSQPLPKSSVSGPGTRALRKARQHSSNSLFQQRKRREAALMGLVAIGGIYSIRIGIEPVLQLAIEIVLVLTCLAAGLLVHARTQAAGSKSAGEVVAGHQRKGVWFAACLSCVVGAICLPALVRMLTVNQGVAPAWEMVWLTSLGIGAVSLALFAWRERDIGLSVIASGFLVLFAAASADASAAVWLAIFWAMICLWWLVANHWERLDHCMSDSVRRLPMMRLGTTLGGLALATVTALVAWGQFGASQRISWGFMPTSGGDIYSDGTSRSGVGNGEAIVAAQEHAATFGAVDSDIFLDSDQPSLFDMFDDTIGEPMRPKRQERAIALQQRQTLDSKSKPGESGRAGDSFPIARQNAKQPTNFDSDETDVVLRWIGQRGAHLAMERFTIFDGKDWHQGGSGIRTKLDHQQLKDDHWFFIRRGTDEGFYRGTTQQAVKVMRLDSSRIPAPAEVAGVSVQDVDRDDFFALESDGSLVMPGRQSIPRQTNIRLVSWGLDAGAVQALEQFPQAQLEPADIQYSSQTELINNPGSQRSEELAGIACFEQLAEQLCKGNQRDWGTLAKVVQYMRSEFTFDRQAEFATEDPLLEFYQQRRGGDHLFATAASIMLRKLGFDTRLTTGFYANPERYNFAEGESKLISDDSHVWLEVRIGNNLWLPVEPTPGYLEPELTASLLYGIADMSWRAMPVGLLGLLMVTVGWFSRAIWGERLCMLAWSVSRLLSPRQRLRVWTKILDVRCRLARCPRPNGVAQRRWIKQVCQPNPEMAWRVDACFDELDAVVYGDRNLSRTYWNGNANELIRQLSVRFIIRNKK